MTSNAPVTGPTRRIVWDRETYEEMYEATCDVQSHTKFYGKKYSYGPHWFVHSREQMNERVEKLHDILDLKKATKVLVAGAGLGMLQYAAEQKGATHWRSFDDSSFILKHQHPAVKIYHHDLQFTNKYYQMADWIITDNCLEEYADLSFLERWPDNALHIVTPTLNPPFQSRTLEEYKAIEPRHLWLSTYSWEVM